ncbi:hypothetical protein PsorP6_010185 [Peronosclerospora sorghi]|uniref:Uncharacterized protein n=1 Tax=Peronosclerospora sorghi TaxID=230839 RepID=A0ACC0VXX5_9STRA|nr:hypothetical protein PsorP6_018663 [Peronosclerospora sorghi]KAI9910606.1 hypothetical protein PsorP6_010185 [Peronosclerospora sorghi]
MPRTSISTHFQRKRTGRPKQKFNYELFNCNNFNIRYWSWNYRGCWHQTCPPIDPPVSKAPSPESNPNSPLPVNAMKLNRFIAQKRDPHSYYDSTQYQPEDCIGFNLINATRPTSSWVFMHVLALELLRLSK